MSNETRRSDKGRKINIDTLSRERSDKINLIVWLAIIFVAACGFAVVGVFL